MLQKDSINPNLQIVGISRTEIFSARGIFPNWSPRIVAFEYLMIGFSPVSDWPTPFRLARLPFGTSSLPLLSLPTRHEISPQIPATPYECLLHRHWHCRNHHHPQSFVSRVNFIMLASRSTAIARTAWLPVVNLLSDPD